LVSQRCRDRRAAASRPAERAAIERELENEGLVDGEQRVARSITGGAADGGLERRSGHEREHGNDDGTKRAASHGASPSRRFLLFWCRETDCGLTAHLDAGGREVSVDIVRPIGMALAPRSRPEERHG